jgi:hypothetical protein
LGGGKDGGQQGEQSLHRLELSAAKLVRPHQVDAIGEWRRGEQRCRRAAPVRA